MKLQQLTNINRTMLKSIFQNYAPSSNNLLLQAIFLITLLLFRKADPMAIVFAYVFETIIIGFIHLVKLFYIVSYNEPHKKSSKILDYISIPFFLIHFGAFVGIQSIIIYTGFAINDNRFSTSLSLSNFVDIFNLEGFKIIALSIIISNLASFYFSFLKTRKFENQNLEAYMVKPYLRIFVQQFLAIIPFFFLYFMNTVGIVAAILLIIMRTTLDFYFIAIANNPEKIKKLALKILDKNKPEELPKIEKALVVFFEE